MYLQQHVFAVYQLKFGKLMKLGGFRATYYMKGDQAYGINNYNISYGYCGKGEP